MRQEAFVSALKDDPNLSPHDGVLVTTLEELKTVIADRLAKKAEAPRASSGLKRVYLLFEAPDEDAVEPIDDHLYERGFEVKRPLFSGSEEQRQVDHAEKLRIADAVLLYYGAANEAWLSRMLLDLAQTPAPGRATGLYVADPKTKAKARYRTREVDVVIKAFEAFTPELLTPFLETVEGALESPR